MESSFLLMSSLRNQKSDLLERTSQRGSTFIYVPQKRGTPLIGSNVATVLCLHKRITSSPKPILYAISSPTRSLSDFLDLICLFSYYSTIEKFCKKKFHFQSKKCVILRIFFTCLTEAFIIFTDPLTGRAITLVGIFTMVLDIRLTRLCSGFKSFEKSLEMILSR